MCILIIRLNPAKKITLTVEAKYSIKKFCSSLHYNGSSNFLFVNGAKIYRFKAKHSEIKIYSLCLENISEDFAANNMEKNRIK